MLKQAKYTITEIENMVPYERDLYIQLQVEYIQALNAPNLISDGGYSDMLQQVKDGKAQP